MGVGPFVSAVASAALAAVTAIQYQQDADHQAGEVARIAAVMARASRTAANDPVFEPFWTRVREKMTPTVRGPLGAGFLSPQKASEKTSQQASEQAAQDTFARQGKSQQGPSAHLPAATLQAPPALRQSKSPLTKPAADSKPPRLTARRADAMAQAERHAADVESRAMAEDADTRAHEAAHQSAGAHLAGGVHLDFSTLSIPMPDGSARSITYASAGSVPIAVPSLPVDMTPGPGASAKLSAIQSDLKTAEAAALAPGAGLSSADSAIAAMAASMATQAAAMMAALEQKPAPQNKPAPFSSKMPDFSALTPPFSPHPALGRANRPIQTHLHNLPVRSSRPAGGAGMPWAAVGASAGDRGAGDRTQKAVLSKRVALVPGASL